VSALLAERPVNKVGLSCQSQEIATCLREGTLPSSWSIDRIAIAAIPHIKPSMIQNIVHLHPMSAIVVNNDGKIAHGDGILANSV
jgi:hypothetical protein